MEVFYIIVFFMIFAVVFRGVCECYKSFWSAQELFKTSPFSFHVKMYATGFLTAIVASPVIFGILIAIIEELLAV